MQAPDLQPPADHLVIVAVHANEADLAYAPLHQIQHLTAHALPDLQLQIPAGGKQLRNGMVHIAIVHVGDGKGFLIQPRQIGAQPLQFMELHQQ